MSQKKKEIRIRFRTQVFDRDGERDPKTGKMQWKCRVCGWHEDTTRLDAHHIKNRNELPFGGYVKENGITLCPECHQKAEMFHSTGHAHIGYSVDDLYEMIGSNFELAKAASEKTKGN